MDGTKLIAFLQQNAIALLALFVALGGTGYAASTISGKAPATASKAPPAGHLPLGGCALGKLRGSATINGEIPKFPSTYTSSKPYLGARYNCSFQPVRVRRAGRGLYVIKFPLSRATLGIGQVSACVEVSPGFVCLYSNGRTVAVSKVINGPDKGGFQVLVQDSTTGANVDAIVNVLVF